MLDAEDRAQETDNNTNLPSLPLTSTVRAAQLVWATLPAFSGKKSSALAVAPLRPPMTVVESRKQWLHYKGKETCADQKPAKQGVTGKWKVSVPGLIACYRQQA